MNRTNAGADGYERITLTLEILPDPQAKLLGDRFARSGSYRVRVLLKWALRVLGLKCVSVTTTPPAGGFQVKSAEPNEVSHAG